MASVDPYLTDPAQASGWYSILPLPPAAARLKGAQTADWVVAGAGVSGLGAARRLGEMFPDARVVLLESFRAGYGASGRNAGFILDAPHNSEDQDAADNLCLGRLVRAGSDALERLVRDHQIDCEWSRIGHLHAVVESKRAGVLEDTRRLLDSVGEDYEWLEREQIHDITGTRHYAAAVRVPRTVVVNPAAMCRGLAATMPANVEVFEESPVRKITSGSPVRIDCAEGSVTTPALLLTTNAFTPDLGFAKGKTFPLLAYGSLTRRLTEAEQSALSGDREWALTPAALAGSTLRRTRSQHILFRHHVRYSGNFRMDRAAKQKIAALHRANLAKRYPALADIAFERTWGGVICMTSDKRAVFDRLAPGVFASIAYNGVGMARGTISGALLAEYAAGGGSALIDDAKSLAGPRRLPPKPALGIGVNAVLAWKRLRGRGEG